MEETDRLFACEYCRVKSYLWTKDFFRYTFTHENIKGKPLIFLPYWRFKGGLFSCVHDGIRHRIVDISHKAVRAGAFPQSLGLRSQTLRMCFLTPEMEGRFLKPTVSRKELRDLAEKRFSALLPGPVFGQSVIGETMSQVYAPFYVEDRVYDAILNRPVSSSGLKGSDPGNLSFAEPDWRIRFLPALCPECGWDLEGDRDSLCLICRNCQSVWTAGKGGFSKTAFGCIPKDGEEKDYLPFYRINAEVSGIQLDSYADMVRIGNLPKVVQPYWEERKFRFWVPAFKVRPKDLLRLSLNLTLHQPSKSLTRSLPPGKAYPVTLPVNEASRFLKIILAGFMKPRKRLFPELDKINIKTARYVLSYIPFAERGNELAQPDYRLRINKKVLFYARHL